MDTNKRTNISIIDTKVTSLFTEKKLDAENIAKLNADMKAWNDVEDGRQGFMKEMKRLEYFVKRLQLSMAIFGIYLPPSNIQSARDRPVEEKVGSKPSKFLLYSIVVLSLLWGSFVRFIVSFFLDTLTTAEIMLRLVSVCWQLQVCLNATVMVKTSYNGNQLNMCRDNFSKVLPKISELGIETDLRKMNRNLLIGYILCWACILFNTITILTVFAIQIGIIQDILLPLFLSPFPVHTVTKVVAGILHLFNSVTWLLPILYFVTMTSILKYAFYTCELALQKELTESNSERSVFPESIEDIRFLHLDICKSVEILDRDFSYLLANLYATSIPLACLFTYALIKTQPDTFNIILCTFWGIAGVCCVIVASGFTASLHESVSFFFV